MQGFKKVTTITYKKITDYDPYPHQIETYEALAQKQSVILRAPTGSGKSEAVFIPFVDLRGKCLPHRMIYSLPMRALVNSLHRRFLNYSHSLSVRAQHGSRPETVLFDADCIVATLDQVITSYACAPLSLSVRHGNIPAGAVASSFHVFDEVHTYEPLLGLQSSLILAERMKNLTIPFVIMSATLPTGFVSSLSKRLNAKLIDIQEETLSIRANRSVFLRERLTQELTPDIVMDMHNGHNGKTIVVCNTVNKAVKLYLELKERMPQKPILIHSRFLDDDRAEKEALINKLFGKNSHEKVLLITTQVIEVGMDISCDLLLSELAPIDSLIQRAGRCARWGGEGELFVFGIPFHAPYEQSIVEKTKTVIEKYGDKEMTWKIEKEMVDEVLDEPFSKLLDISSGAKAMMYLSRAAFEGNRGVAEKAVRDSLSVEVSIHDEPIVLGNNLAYLPRCKVHPSTLKGFISETGPKLWRIEEDREAIDDYAPRIEVIEVKRVSDVFPNAFYVIQSDFACYSTDEGLLLGRKGNPLEPNLQKEESEKQEPNQIPLETWKEHALKTLQVFEREILIKEKTVYEKYAASLGTPFETFVNYFRIVLLLHDLGKLTEEWQAKIGAKNGEFLAHSGGPKKFSLPPHATVTAYILRDYLRSQWGKTIGEASFFAIAHHHSVRATKVPKYRLCSGWDEEVNQVLLSTVGLRIESETMKKFDHQDSPTSLSSHIPAFEKEKIYHLYLILSRALRLSDRWAITKKLTYFNN